MNKTLVTYFSATGTTRKVALKLNEIVKGDLYEIEPVNPYTYKDLDWNDKNSRSSLEMNDKNARPKFKKTLGNIDQYQTIYIGFPIWWYTAPRIINTFLESYNFENKIIIPFATSGGSGYGNTNDDLKKSLSNNGEILDGKVLNHVTFDEMKMWVESIK